MSPTQQFKSEDGRHVFTISIEHGVKLHCTCAEWRRIHFCDWALEKLGPAANPPLASGTIVDGAIQTMGMRSPDLVKDIGELYGDWKDEKIFGKKFSDEKLMIGNRILSRRFCDSDHS